MIDPQNGVIKWQGESLRVESNPAYMSPQTSFYYIMADSNKIINMSN